MSGTLSTPDDTATLQLHLTMENQGTVWHDGVTLVEVVAGDLLGIESRHATPGRDLADWQVPAVIKVFRDDLPPGLRKTTGRRRDLLGPQRTGVAAVGRPQSR